MIFDEFDICYGAVNKDLKNGKDLDNICFKEVLGKVLIGFLKRRLQYVDVPLSGNILWVLVGNDS